MRAPCDPKNARCRGFSTKRARVVARLYVWLLSSYFTPRHQQPAGQRGHVKPQMIDAKLKHITTTLSIEALCCYCVSSVYSSTTSHTEEQYSRLSLPFLSRGLDTSAHVRTRTVVGMNTTPHVQRDCSAGTGPATTHAQVGATGPGATPGVDRCTRKHPIEDRDSPADVATQHCRKRSHNDHDTETHSYSLFMVTSRHTRSKRHRQEAVKRFFKRHTGPLEPETRPVQAKGDKWNNVSASA